MYFVTIKNGDTERLIHRTVDFNDPKLTTGVMRQGINRIKTFKFEILPNHPYYDEFHSFTTLIEVYNQVSNHLDFVGRVLSATEIMNREGLIIKRILCESEMAYLTDSHQRFHEFRGSVRELLEHMLMVHNRQVEENKKFLVGDVEFNDNLYRFVGYENTFDEIIENITSRIGGELRVRVVNSVRYLDLVEKIGAERDTEIRLSKNLISITKQQDPTAIITRLLPLGARLDDGDDDEVSAVTTARVTIETVNNGRDYIDDTEGIAEFGIIEGTHIWDDVTLPINLLSRALNYLHENNRIKTQYTVSALDLASIGLDMDTFEVGNSYQLINQIMNVDTRLRVVQKTIDIMEPQRSELEIGDKFQTIQEFQLNGR